MQRLTRWAAAVALVATSCGGVGDIAVDPEKPLPAAKLGACPGGTTHYDGPGGAPPLLRPGAWFRAERIAAGGARREVVKAFSGTYVPLGGDPGTADPQPPGKLRMEGFRAKAVEAALKARATVYLKRTASGTVGLAYALRGDEHAMLGSCEVRATETMERRYGPFAAKYLAAAAGKPVPEVLRVMGYRPDADPDDLGWAWREMWPDATPPGVVESLRAGTFAVEAPPSWRGKAYVCVEVHLGVSGCVDLARPRPVTFRYDPARPRIALVVRAAGRYERRALHHPDLRNAAKRGGIRVDDPRPLRLTLTLAREPSLRTVLTGNAGQVFAYAVDRLRLAPG